MSGGPGDKVLDTFKDLVFQPMVKAATSAIIGLAPFLAFPPLAFIITKVVGFVANFLYAQFSTIVNLNLIMLTNEQHHAAFVKASDELQATFDKYGMNSPEFARDREAHQKALSAFVRHPN